jgi:hypothetical protein
MKITISPEGEVRMIAGNGVDATQLGAASKQRASHVLPVNRPLRWLFRWLRDRYGETGRVAAFTRRWPCLWSVDMSPVGGPVMGPYRLRETAIAVEVQWLESFYL